MKTVTFSPKNNPKNIYRWRVSETPASGAIAPLLKAKRPYTVRIRPH